MRTDGRTDRHDEANNRFFFRNFANTLKELRYCPAEVWSLLKLWIQLDQ